MSSELEHVASQVMAATSYFDLFGACPDGEAVPKHISGVVRRLARILHPDRWSNPADAALAQRAFARLSELQQDAKHADTAGQYGSTVLATLSVNGMTHQVLRPDAAGDLCATYLTRTEAGGTVRETFLKVATNPADNDLLETEATVLRVLRGATADPKWVPFVPELLDSFGYDEPGHTIRQANVIVHLPGFYNIGQVIRAYPAGLDPLDMAWIWRRLLVALGYAHDMRIVHGAVLPQHVMILPEQHGLVLVDWCYASLDEGHGYPPIKAVAANFRDWYPTETLGKQPPTPATDILMAARCIIHLMGGDAITGTLPASVPGPLSAFFRGCLQPTPALRPQNAWLLLKEFDALLQRMGSPYYPRRFRSFVMP